jgi:hypothetical protein
MANKNDAPSTEIASSGDGAITGTISPKQLTAQFHAYMRSRAEDAVTDNAERSEEIMEEQAARILMGESVEDIMSADMGGTVQCRDVPGTFWEVRGFSVLKGNRDDIEKSNGYYVQFDAVCIGGDAQVMARNGLKRGEKYPLQTSALLLTTKVRALESKNAFPVQLALIGNRTGSGNTVLKWGEMPVTVMSGTAA